MVYVSLPLNHQTPPTSIIAVQSFEISSVSHSPIHPTSLGVVIVYRHKDVHRQAPHVPQMGVINKDTHKHQFPSFHQRPAVNIGSVMPLDVSSSVVVVGWCLRDFASYQRWNAISRAHHLLCPSVFVARTECGDRETPTITALTSTLRNCGANWSLLKGEEGASPDNLLLDSLTFQTTSPYHMAPWPHTNSFHLPATHKSDWSSRFQFTTHTKMVYGRYLVRICPYIHGGVLVKWLQSKQLGQLNF